MQQKSNTTITLRQNEKEFPKSLKQQMEATNPHGWVTLRDDTADQLVHNGNQVNQWNVVQLSIKGAQNDGIPKAIREIMFPHLQILYLSQNNISSIQSIGRINAQNIRKIDLMKNKIICVSQLRKIQSSQIQSFQIDDNLINQAECIAEFNLDKIVGFSFQSYLVNMGMQYCSSNQCQNIIFCAKIRNQNCNTRDYYLEISSNDRIRQKTVVQKLIQKYFMKPTVTIKTKDGHFTKTNIPSKNLQKSIKQEYIIKICNSKLYNLSDLIIKCSIKVKKNQSCICNINTLHNNLKTSQKQQAIIYQQLILFYSLKRLQRFFIFSLDLKFRKMLSDQINCIDLENNTSDNLKAMKLKQKNVKRISYQKIKL